MKRMILRVVVMAFTFALGVTAYHLIIKLVSNNTPLVSKNEVVSPVAPAPPVVPVVPVAPVAALPEATPKPHIILDYDPDTFYPWGMYQLMGPKPAEFENFEGFEIGSNGYSDDVPAYLLAIKRYPDGPGTTSAIFAMVTKRRLVFATLKSSDTGIEYRFEGDFLRTDFDSVDGKNIPVLRGVLTRSKDGRTLVERTVSFRFEYMGC